MTSLPSRVAATLAGSVCCFAGLAHAYEFTPSEDWKLNFDNTLQYDLGMRAQGPNANIQNSPFWQEGEYKFPKAGDIVTNQVSDLVELQAIYQGRMGARLSGSLWKDFAYDSSKIETNPAYTGSTSYLGNKYNDYASTYYQQGGELLDAFVFTNTEVADKPTYLKAGRLSEYWGNALFFGFSNIAYSQQPIDFAKAFAQPGSEVKELFLPRTQVSVSTELTPNLSVSAQYFFEYEPDLFPEAGTYLGFNDFLFKGPNQPGYLANYGITGIAGMVRPKNVNNNFGVKVNWSPDWAAGDMGFYYRRFDEVMPWMFLVNKDNVLQDPFAQGVTLLGFSYERAFGELSTGLEVNRRIHTALSTGGFSGLGVGGTDVGVKGDLDNVIANGFLQLGGTPLWDTGILLGEFSFTHLDSVTSNQQWYNGVGSGYAGCDSQGIKNGCATKNALAVAVLFDPQWLQVIPGIDLDAPMSLTWGIAGNPAYAAGSFYAQNSQIYSVGIRATYHAATTLALTYTGYHWQPNSQGAGIANGTTWATYDGAVALNDRGWVQLQLKTSF